MDITKANTPWVCGDTNVIFDKDGNMLCYISSHDSSDCDVDCERAALIVKAVNEYSSLLAIKEAAEAYDNATSSWLSDGVDATRQKLARVCEAQGKMSAALASYKALAQ